MQKNKSFILHSNCFTTQGIARSLIMDSLNEKVYFIPNTLCELLEKFSGKTVAMIEEYLGFQQLDILSEYFDFLEENKLIMYTDQQNYFPQINMSFDMPRVISNAIIDCSRLNDSYWVDTIIELDMLGCRAVELRFLEKIDLKAAGNFLVTFEQTNITHIEAFINIKENYDVSTFVDFKKYFKHMCLMYLFTCQEFGIEEHGLLNEEGIFLLNSVPNAKNCGLINNYSFNYSVGKTIEARKFNSCLNRKISIDVDGNIRNCPSMKESFGNIKDTTLMEAIEKPGFKKYWNITKDEITKCKDCEFRHVCTDCRAYLDNPDDIYSAPLKCGYDPYSCEWEEWSTNPLKQQAIDYYGMRELVEKEADR